MRTRYEVVKPAPAARRSPASVCATPFGLVPQAGIANLCEFGEQAERLEYPYIDVGGFIVPGRGPAASITPGWESDDDVAARETGQWGESARTEAGPPAGPWEGQATPEAAAPGASPHAFEQRLAHLNLDLPALVDYHPRARVTASTAEAVYLDVPLGLFRDLPVRARLTLEVPLHRRDRLSRTFVESRVPLRTGELILEPRIPTEVPDVRAWAAWQGGSLDGVRITSHHQNPDASICACRPLEWVRGVHPLTDYIAFCALWVGKALHERLLGFYPGRQHYGPLDRVRRDRIHEYCGCGSTRRYGACCRADDRMRTPYALWTELYHARAQYLSELAWQRRSPGPPTVLPSIRVSTR